jgi:dTDP-4-dehydrorhamnose reductase
MTKPLLITGGSGFLGGNLVSIASTLCETYFTYHSSPCPTESPGAAICMDVTDQAQTEKIVQEISPAVIIHTAAVTNAGYCEEHQQAAWDINVNGTRNVASAAEKVGARLIYASTDMVFSGTNSFHSERDSPNPGHHYGKTKLMGEQIVQSVCSNYCIARIALVYGRSANESKCFTETMLDRMGRGESVRLFVDEYRTPIYAKNLCHALLELAEREDLQGIYHLAGPERLSRFEFGLKLAEIFGLDKKLLNPVSVDDVAFAYERPRDCSLSHTKATGVLNTRFWNVEEALNDMKSMSRTPALSNLA